MITTKTVISNAHNCFIEVVRRDSEPASWIVNRSKKTFWSKKRISSKWFIDGQEAFAYANELKNRYEMIVGMAKREDIS